jgi:hypothetical protein
MDRDLLALDSTFEILSLPHRMNLILDCLRREDIAKPEQSYKGIVLGWVLSERLRECFDVKSFSIVGEMEDVECPAGIFSAADEFSRILRTRPYLVAETVSAIIRKFQMHDLGFLEYHGKKDGLSIFRKSAKCEAMEADEDAREFIERYFTA